MPVTVTELVPVAAVGPTVKVSTELPDGPIDVGEKAAVTPEGRPETDSVIVNPYEPNGVKLLYQRARSLRSALRP